MQMTTGLQPNAAIIKNMPVIFQRWHHVCGAASRVEQWGDMQWTVGSQQWWIQVEEEKREKEAFTLNQTRPASDFNMRAGVQVPTRCWSLWLNTKSPGCFFHGLFCQSAHTHTHTWNWRLVMSLANKTNPSTSDIKPRDGGMRRWRKTGQRLKIRMKFQSVDAVCSPVPVPLLNVFFLLGFISCLKSIFYHLQRVLTKYGGFVPSFLLTWRPHCANELNDVNEASLTDT